MQTNSNAQRDVDTLTALNRDYDASVQKADVKRLKEILADDFMCSNPDGSLLSVGPAPGENELLEVVDHEEDVVA